jgi:hypothetical protein
MFRICLRHITRTDILANLKVLYSHFIDGLGLREKLGGDDTTAVCAFLMHRAFPGLSDSYIA